MGRRPLLPVGAVRWAALILLLAPCVHGAQSVCRIALVGTPVKDTLIYGAPWNVKEARVNCTSDDGSPVLITPGETFQYYETVTSFSGGEVVDGFNRRSKLAVPRKSAPSSFEQGSDLSLVLHSGSIFKSGYTTLILCVDRRYRPYALRGCSCVAAWGSVAVQVTYFSCLDFDISRCQLSAIY